jgi:ClpP class serine protease
MTTSAILARLSAPWVIDARALDGLQHRLARALRGEETPAVSTAKKSKPLSPSRRGTVGVISVHGVLVQRTDELSDLFGETGYEDIARAVRSAVDDPEVDAVVMHFASPGGQAYGASECAAAIASATKAKRCIAVVDPLAASGAYWLASQCSEIVMTPSGECGSIGVYQMHVDRSKQLEEMGIKVTPVSVGKRALRPLRSVALSEAL